jgi:hypothetical protein
MVQFDYFRPGRSGLDTSRNYLARLQGHLTIAQILL